MNLAVCIHFISENLKYRVVPNYYIGGFEDEYAVKLPSNQAHLSLSELSSLYDWMHESYERDVYLKNGQQVLKLDDLARKALFSYLCRLTVFTLTGTFMNESLKVQIENDAIIHKKDELLYEGINLKLYDRDNLNFVKIGNVPFSCGDVYLDNELSKFILKVWNEK